MILCSKFYCNFIEVKLIYRYEDKFMISLNNIKV